MSDIIRKLIWGKQGCAGGIKVDLIVSFKCLKVSPSLVRSRKVGILKLGDLEINYSFQTVLPRDRRFRDEKDIFRRGRY